MQKQFHTETFLHWLRQLQSCSEKELHRLSCSCLWANPTQTPLKVQQFVSEVIQPQQVHILQVLAWYLHMWKQFEDKVERTQISSDRRWKIERVFEKWHIRTVKIYKYMNGCLKKACALFIWPKLDFYSLLSLLFTIDCVRGGMVVLSLDIPWHSCPAHLWLSVCFSLRTLCKKNPRQTINTGVSGRGRHMDANWRLKYYGWKLKLEQCMLSAVLAVLNQLGFCHPVDQITLLARHIADWMRFKEVEIIRMYL